MRREKRLGVAYRDIHAGRQAPLLDAKHEPRSVPFWFADYLFRVESTGTYRDLPLFARRGTLLGSSKAGSKGARRAHAPSARRRMYYILYR